MMTTEQMDLALGYLDAQFFGGALKAWSVRLGRVDAGGDRGSEVDPAERVITLDLPEIEDQGEDIFETLTRAMARASVSGIEGDQNVLFRNVLRKLYRDGGLVDPSDFDRYGQDFEPVRLAGEQ